MYLCIPNYVPMLLIFVPKLTNRLGYTLNFVFRNILRTDFTITTDVDIFHNHTDAKLCYGPNRIDDAVWIKSCNLLFQTSIESQDLHCFTRDDMHAFFPVYGRDLDFDFDLLAATFYLITRYEEYMPHHTDEHGRYLASESVAYQQGFLRVPIADQWAVMLANKIVERYPAYQFPPRNFDFVNTIDIDAAYCYKHKDIFRSLTGLGRDLLHRHDIPAAKLRCQVLAHRTTDPFDTFEYILEQQQRHRGIAMVFFALLADYGVNDKNISHHNEEFRQLLKHLGDYAKIGIHTSYASFDEPRRVELERERLADIIHRNITRNRSHFLRIQLPKSYRTLIHYGIQHDFTMGYAEEPGFRAGTSVAYPFYDLESDCETPLTIHPFAVMEATLKRYQNMSPADAWEVFKQLMDAVKAVDGTFSCIWHNENLCEDFGWKGWRKVYEQMLDYGEKLRSKSFTP